MTKEVHGDTKVCKQTPPEATQASGYFFLTGICWVSDVQLAKYNLGRKEANLKSSKCNEEELIAWD